MRPRLILLFVLATLTLSLVAFLINGQGAKKIMCAQTPCCKERQAPKPAETGGGGMDDGSFHHLIVSTIK
ncbi:hypothetical protein GWC95_00985 [Sediminibacterium roseum]|uniref:Uncharacterized protein n=1 Tax=Sediminibacterium roseum TaxID=1978412 RepID=A0ABW9ZN36_9BACT|nr:hypothetical protein [Sediminibacterium roseum]NCI48476.1 hypothetical protein [Sediminibacterium roseum]